MKLAQNALAGGFALLVALAGALYLSAQNSLAAPDGGVVGTGTPGSCTEAALDAAMAGGGGVTFNCGANPFTLTLTSLLSITTTTTVDGGGKITLSGGHTTRVFVVQSGILLTLKNLTVADGKAAFGGCVAAFGPVTTVQATLRNCHSTVGGLFPGDGGALAIVNANLSMSNTQILDNRADVNGGGLYINGGSHTLDHVTITANRADITYTDSGGGIYVENNALLTILNSHVDNNIFGYTGYGGGIAAFTSTLQLVNVSLNNNLGENAGLGGGLYVQNAIADLNAVTIDGNSHLYAGGGIDSEASGLTIVNSDISSNVASSSGGGLSTYLGSLNLTNVSVNGNVVGSDGGGIDLYDTPTTLNNSTISNNRGGRDGAGINVYRNTLNLKNVTLSGNVNDGGALVGGQGTGGGIFNDSAILLIHRSTLSNNSSSGYGGGIYNQYDSTTSLTNTTLSANVAITGGGIYNEQSFTSQPTVITLTDVTLKDNRATAGGGIVNENGAFDFVFLKDTIIADSFGGNCKGKAFTFSKYSLSSDTTCGLAGLGNLNNTPAQLNPLGNYGGPTQTHLPRATSPAVNGVGDNDCPLIDQRGVVRPQGGSCDIGSVERQPSDPLLVPLLYLPVLVR